MKIMIVEDHPKIREELSALLRRYGYETCAPSSFDHIVEAILQEGADLILLDINLPLFDGYYICREVRKASAVPIIIVTSRDSETDELMSMNLGADDFITKPYNTQILLAHIASVLKRAYRSPEESAELSWNGVSLILSRSAARCGDRETELSKNETRILHVLIRNRDTIVSRDVIMQDRLALGHHAGPVGLRRLRGRQYAHRQHQPPAQKACRNRRARLYCDETRAGLHRLTYRLAQKGCQS